MTAHPTEVQRKSILDAEREIARLLVWRDRVVLTPQECAELVKHYLEHDGERRAVAKAGQERTLRDHTYQQRMKELADIVRKHV